MTLDRDEVRAVLEESFRAHTEDDNGMIVGPDRLIERILRGLGLSDEYRHNGWTIRRVPGDSVEWKGHRLRGANKSSYGYIATHPDGERETFAPTDGIPPHMDSVRRSLDLLDKVKAKYKEMAAG